MFSPGPGFDTRSGNILSFLLPLFQRRAVVSYWRKYVHEVLVNRLGDLSLPRKSVVRLTDRPDMTLDVYRGRKTTIQQQHVQPNFYRCLVMVNSVPVLCLSLVTISRQISYAFGILRQDYGIIRGFIGHHQSTNLV